MPGAGSLVAVRSIDVTQPKDGTVIATFNSGLITRSIVQPDIVNLDFRKFAWVGSVTPDFRVCYGYGPEGVSTGDDMMKRNPFVISATAAGSGDYLNGATLRVVFGAPIKQVLGFPGSSELHIAIEQGELDGDCGSYSSIPPDWLQKNLARIFVRFTRDRPPEIPATATFINDFAKTRDQDLLDFLNSATEVGRPFVMSATVPADRIAILRKAFDDAMKDPAFLAQMSKEQLPVHPVNSQDAEQIVSKILTVAPGIVAKAKAIYTQP
jgi:tripartite-type tricarboxylate transporter receptor subunit TctC